MFEQSYDYDYYHGLWLDMQRAWGTPPEMLAACYIGGSMQPREAPYGDLIVRFPTSRPVSFEEGRSPRILATSNMVVSRLATKEPEYELKHIPLVDAEVRKQVLKVRMTDSEDGTPWFRERMGAFSDGHDCGVGVLEIGLEENSKSGFDMMTAQHVPVLQHFTDWWCADPTKSRWGMSAFYVHPEVAAREFGWKAVKPHIQKDESGVGRGGVSVSNEYVRILRRFDVGYGPKGDPTYMLWLGSYKDSPIVCEYNKFERNPHAYAVNTIKSGMDRPIGAIFEMRSDAESLHSLEKRIRNLAENGGEIDILYEMGLNPDDLEAAQAGLQRFVRSTTPMDKAPYYRLPGQNAGNDLWNLVSYYHQRFGTSGNAADLEFAMGGGDKTATQVTEEASRLNQNRSRARAMMIHFQVAEVECARAAAIAGDRHPTTIEVQKRPVRVNQPGKPHSWLNEWFADRATVVIDEAAMTADESMIESSLRLDYLDRIATMAERLDPEGAIVDRRWLIEEYVKANGKDDPEVALMKASEQAALPMVPPGAMPGPMGQQMPLKAV